MQRDRSRARTFSNQVFSLLTVRGLCPFTMATKILKIKQVLKNVFNLVTFPFSCHQFVPSHHGYQGQIVPKTPRILSSIVYNCPITDNFLK